MQRICFKEQSFSIKLFAYAKLRYKTVSNFSNTKFEKLPNVKLLKLEAMFTLYRIVKRSDAESVPDRASVQTRNTAFGTVSAPEQYCSAPLLKVERSVSDRFLRRSESSLNTLSEQKLQRNLVLENDIFKSKGSVANCITDMASVHTGTLRNNFCTTTEH